MKKNRKNNCMKILAYIKKHGSITFKICERPVTEGGLNIPRCGARIWDLRNLFHVAIDSTMHYSQNEKYAVYTLGTA